MKEPMKEEEKEPPLPPQPIYYPPPYYQYPYQKPEHRILGMKKDTFYAVVFVFIVIICITVLPMIFSIFMFGMFDSWGAETVTKTYDLVINEDNHFRHTLPIWDIEGPVNISVECSNGEKVDVFLMDEDSYSATYNSTTAGGVVSAMRSWKNVSSLNESIEIDGNMMYDDITYIVIDNTDLTLLSDDAIPEGTVDVKLIITYNVYNYMD